MYYVFPHFNNLLYISTVCVCVYLCLCVCGPCHQIDTLATVSCMQMSEALKAEIWKQNKLVNKQTNNHTPAPVCHTPSTLSCHERSSVCPVQLYSLFVSDPFLSNQLSHDMICFITVPVRINDSAEAFIAHTSVRCWSPWEDGGRICRSVRCLSASCRDSLLSNSQEFKKKKKSWLSCFNTGIKVVIGIIRKDFFGQFWILSIGYCA